MPAKLEYCVLKGTSYAVKYGSVPCRLEYILATSGNDKVGLDLELC